MIALTCLGEEKEDAIRNLAGAYRGGIDHPEIRVLDPAAFRLIPGSPFAYWIDEAALRLFEFLPPFEDEVEAAKVGLQTSDDFRFLRLWWEPDTAPRKWRSFAKGGAFSPFFGDIHLVVNWEGQGREIRSFVDPRSGRLKSRPQSTVYYGRPGITWTRRTTSDFSPRALPGGGIFSDQGPAVFCEIEAAPSVLAVMNSRVFRALLGVQMKAIEGAARAYEIGYVSSTPVPREVCRSHQELIPLVRRAWRLVREGFRTKHGSLAFLLPQVLQCQAPSLETGLTESMDGNEFVRQELARVEAEIEEAVERLYGISTADGDLSGEIGAAPSPSGDEENEDAERADPVTLTESLIEWALGTALGRFDVRLATGERQPPPNPDPFDPLPVCSPGMLRDEDGLPAREPPAGYPTDLPPHGLLVDDPGHPWDVVSRIEAVFDLVAGDRGHAWIQEAEDILGRDLRDWLRRYGFERHLKRYSRSRRKAPLFWHLAPKSREYGIWLNSPVATRDTFYRIQNDYLDPKLKAAERRLLELRQHAGGSPTGQQRKDLTAQESLVEDLRAFREQVATVAPLWRPFRDDGVVLNCAVLSRLFDHHRAWQKECAKKWGELSDGKYDWAGWAMHLWPERAVATCASDRSIAIAHGLEEALWRETDDGKWKPRPDADQQVARLTAERRSPALKAALDVFERGA